MATTTISSGTTASNLAVQPGDTLNVLNGGIVSSTTVLSGGLLTVQAGGIDSAATLSAGANETVLGTANGDAVYGTQLVSAATAAVSNETVYNGGAVDLFLKGVIGTGITVLGGGALNISGNAVASNTVLSNGTLDLESAKASLTGSVTLIGTGNTITVAAAQSISAGSFAFEGAVISGFTTGDVIDVTAIVSGAAISLTSTATATTETVNVTSGGTVLETLVFTPGTGTALAADAGGNVEVVACFCPGTHIRTEQGEVAVEDLRVGDAVVTVDGSTEAIRWIGRRSYTGRTLAGRRHLHPVRIRAGALGDATPKRDLVISPLHAMLIDGVLVPAHALVNGTTIIQEAATGAVHYIHIELPQHNAVWADGAASETFVDDNGRFIFQSSEGEVAPMSHDPVYYAPRVEHGYQLEAIRQRLAERARLLTA